jgi:hypothetical protein
VTSRRSACGALLLAIAILLSGCVGPATTNSAYSGKAVRTANDALSEVQTARLAVETSLDHNLPRAYLEVLLQEAEDAFSSIQNTFDSIQPPDTSTADKLRDQLDEVLSDGSDALSQLRIAARRDDTGELRTTSASIKSIADKLRSFAEEHA